MLTGRLLLFGLMLWAYTLYGQSQLEADPFAAAFIARNITKDELSDHVHQLASDQFEGRETGTRGQEKAAQYIRQQLEAIGVTPALGQASYFQQVGFTLLLWEKLGLHANGRAFKHLKDFLSLQDANQNLPRFPVPEVIFMGYGIDDTLYSDYKGVNVAGKVIMIYPGEPADASGNSYLTGGPNPSRWDQNISLKLEAAARYRARVVLIVDPDIKRTIGRYRNQVLGRRLYFNDDLPEVSQPNHMYISTEVATEIIGSKQEIFKANLDAIRETCQGKPILLPVDLEINQHLTRNIVYSQNIIGVINGTDSTLQNEYVILSAHYDHLGKRGNSVFPGADDNATGTSAVLEIMETIAEAKAQGLGPKRNVACIFFTGEEKGLLGSQYYAENPVIPMEQTVVDVNVDMIGRADKAHAENPRYIYVIGSNRLSTELHDINEGVNSRFMHLDLDYTYNSRNDPNRFYYRSDHYNFAKYGIPSIFYFSGVHEDYHQPSDTPDKIMYEKYQAVTQLIFHNTWELANRAQAIQVNVADDTEYNRD